MGFVTRLLHGRSDNQRGAGLGEAAAWLHEAMLGPESATGVHVSPESALRYTAVLTCVRVLAEGVASLP